MIVTNVMCNNTKTEMTPGANEKGIVDSSVLNIAEKLKHRNDSINNSNKIKCKYYLDPKIYRMRQVVDDEIYENTNQYSLDSEKFYRGFPTDPFDSSYCYNRESKEVFKFHRFIFSLTNDIEKGHFKKSKKRDLSFSFPEIDSLAVYQPESQDLYTHGNGQYISQGTTYNNSYNQPESQNTSQSTTNNNSDQNGIGAIAGAFGLWIWMLLL
jgi:hypothetical protein